MGLAVGLEETTRVRVRLRMADSTRPGWVDAQLENQAVRLSVAGANTSFLVGRAATGATGAVGASSWTVRGDRRQRRRPRRAWV